MNQEERKDIERFEKIQENTSKIRSREINRLLGELRREIDTEDTEKWDKKVKTIKYHQYEQQQYLIWLQENTESRISDLTLRTNDPNRSIERNNLERLNN